MFLKKIKSLKSCLLNLGKRSIKFLIPIPLFFLVLLGAPIYTHEAIISEEAFKQTIPAPVVEEKIEPAQKTKWAVVTGYTSDPLETDDSPCISADGSDICALFIRGENTCASNDYRFGTILHIDGLGKCTVRDRMAKRLNGKIDWYFGFDKEAAFKHGKRTMKITIEEQFL